MKSIYFLLLLFPFTLLFSQEVAVELDDPFAEADPFAEPEEKVKSPVKVQLPKAKNEQPVDLKKAQQLITELGANHFKIRKNAKKGLIAMGYQVIPLLKENLAKSNDPEVTENIKEIISALTYRLNINQLTEKQKKAAKLPFNQGHISGPKSTAEFYNKEGMFIIDIGITRIVFPEAIKKLNNTFSRTVTMHFEGRNGGGGSSTSNDFKVYQYSYENGTGYWTLCEKSFVIRGYELEIAGEKLNLKPEQPQVLFIDDKGKSAGILDLK